MTTVYHAQVNLLVFLKPCQNLEDENLSEKILGRDGVSSNRSLTANLYTYVRETALFLGSKFPGTAKVLRILGPML
jgi:hypothetical protein